MNQNAQNSQDEIDLSIISRSIRDLFSSISSFIYNCIQFLVRNIIIIVILIVVGVALGYFLKSGDKKYEHTITVTPNFGSVEYLYDKVELLQSKFTNKDTIFLKSAGFTEYEQLLKIDIKPIVDIYKFVKADEINYKTFELLADGANVSKIIEETPTARNYKFHKIEFVTKGKIGDKIVQQLLNYLNKSAFYDEMQVEYTKELKFKMAANEVSLRQIDAILNAAAENLTQNRTTNNFSYYNQSLQLPDLIYSKNNFLRVQLENKLDLMMYDRVVKESSVMTNIKLKNKLNDLLVIIFPILLILFFAFIIQFKKFYSREKLKRQIEG